MRRVVVTLGHVAVVVVVHVFNLLKKIVLVLDVSILEMEHYVIRSHVHHLQDSVQPIAPLALRPGLDVMIPDFVLAIQRVEVVVQEVMSVTALQLIRMIVLRIFIRFTDIAQIMKRLVMQAQIFSSLYHLIV